MAGTEEQCEKEGSAVGELRVANGNTGRRGKRHEGEKGKGCGGDVPKTRRRTAVIIDAGKIRRSLYLS